MNKFLQLLPVWQAWGIGLIRIILGFFMIYHGGEIFEAAKMNVYFEWDIFKSSSGKVLVYMGKSAELVAGIFLFLGKTIGLFHQYKIYYSIDGKKWSILVDKSNNKGDIPHDYVELPNPIKARFIKLENIKMPTGKFAISGLRVFGNGNGDKPDTIKQFMVLRTEKDPRSAWIRWSPVDNAYAYNIYFGTSPDKLYNCIMVYNANEYYYKGMDKLKTYYYSIEAINENGISARCRIMKSQ